MLNGIAPLLVIILKNKGPLDFFGPKSTLNDSIAEPLNDALNAIGLPIPIYLHEDLTGILIESETKGIDVETKVDPVTTKNPITQEVEAPIVSQTSRSSQVTINMVAQNDSFMLTALLSLLDMIVDRLVSGEYAIHYMNGPTVIFGALLHRFSTAVSRADNLIRMELVLSTAAKDAPVAKAAIQSVSKVVGATPL